MGEYARESAQKDEKSCSGDRQKVRLGKDSRHFQMRIKHVMEKNIQKKFIILKI